LIFLGQYDLSGCVTLLPYIVLYLLVHCEAAEKKKLSTEMAAVLRCHEHPTELSSDLMQSGLQAVLLLLDFLREWCGQPDSVKQVRDEQLLISPLHADNPHCQQLIFQVDSFVEAFTDDLLAQASFHCHAYPKALLHYEKYLWQEDTTWTNWRSDKKAMHFMQQVCLSVRLTPHFQKEIPNRSNSQKFQSINQSINR
jgi:hypothetical protein